MKLNEMHFVDFRDSRYPILVATDVAARGLGEYIYVNFSVLVS